MKKKYLATIVEDFTKQRSLKKQIKVAFDTIIAKILNKSFLNRKFENPLQQDIYNGTIYLKKGILYGTFKQKSVQLLKKNGFEYDAKKGGFVIDNKTTEELKAIKKIKESDDKLGIKKIKENFNELKTNYDNLLQSQFSKTDSLIDKTTEALKKQGASLGYAIPVEEKYLKLYKKKIKNIDIKSVLLKDANKIKEQTIDFFKQGKGVKDFNKYIKKISDVSDSRANLIGRQQLAIVNGAYKASVYKENGVDSYLWVSTGDGKVRFDHRLLDGKVFTYAKGAIVDRKTGRRANPGEDFNCRCFDIPIQKGNIESTIISFETLKEARAFNVKRIAA